MINAVIILNYKKTDFDIINQNLKSAGHQIDNLQVVNMEGIAKAMNFGIKLSGYADLYTFVSNDILEPDNWLKIRNNFMTQEIGVCSFPIETPPHYGDQDLIGNLTISRKLYETIGEFNQHFDPYGPIDLDYCARARAAGFKTKYIEGNYSLHPHQHANGDEYGWIKQELVKSKWKDHEQNIQGYSSGSKSTYIIFEQQFC